MSAFLGKFVQGNRVTYRYKVDGEMVYQDGIILDRVTVKGEVGYIVAVLDDTFPNDHLLERWETMFTCEEFLIERLR